MERKRFVILTSFILASCKYSTYFSGRKVAFSVFMFVCMCVFFICMYCFMDEESVHTWGEVGGGGEGVDTPSKYVYGYVPPNGV